MITQTSILSWQELQFSLSKKQQAVYDLIKKHPWRTSAEYVRLSGLEAKHVQPRISELKKACWIRVVGIKKDPITRRPSEYFEAVL